MHCTLNKKLPTLLVSGFRQTSLTLLSWNFSNKSHEYLPNMAKYTRSGGLIFLATSNHRSSKSGQAKSGPACNAAEAVAVNVQQEKLTNAEDSIECPWPLHCHHTNQTHVLHWHDQHPKRGGGGKKNRGFCCHLADFTWLFSFLHGENYLPKRMNPPQSPRSPLV